MRRLTYDKKTCTFIWSDWKPTINVDFGPSVTQKKKYISDKVRINNQEVTSGSSRTALYTMPGGIDNGVRYSALYESSGLDITEVEANKATLKNALDKASKMINEEFNKNVESIKETVSVESSNSKTE